MRLVRTFALLAHRHQDPPAAANDGGPWTTWLVIGGRGAGKTRLGAEWTHGLACGLPPYAERRHLRIALVGETEHDVREVMIEGESGILSVGPRRERPLWLPTRGRLEWPGGAVAQAFSAEDPDALRGFAFDAAWCDELAKWRRAEDAFDMLQFGLRRGGYPRQLITTTPRPIPLIKRLIADDHTAVTRAGTQVNRAFLSPGFLSFVVGRYAGTRLGRQELDGEILEQRADALWSRALIERARVRAAPELTRTVVAIDPPAGDGGCGIVAAGRAADGTLYVLADETVAGLAPHGWASRAIVLYHRLRASTLVVEVNQGGAMVTAVLREVERDVPIRTVHATQGKRARAEPISAMYEQERVKHVDPPMRALEDQMCDFGADGLSGGRSPDRVDALVWALTALNEPVHQGPRITWL